MRCRNRECLMESPEYLFLRISRFSIVPLPVLNEKRETSVPALEAIKCFINEHSNKMKVF